MAEMMHSDTIIVTIVPRGREAESDSLLFPNTDNLSLTAFPARAHEGQW